MNRPRDERWREGRTVKSTRETLRKGGGRERGKKRNRDGLGEGRGRNGKENRGGRKCSGEKTEKIKRKEWVMKEGRKQQFSKSEGTRKLKEGEEGRKK